MSVMSRGRRRRWRGVSAEGGSRDRKYRADGATANPRVRGQSPFELGSESFAMGSDSFAIGVRLLFGNAAVCNDSMRRSRPNGDIDSRMPRPPRIVRAGQTLHLVQRGNNRTACFTCDQDRAYFAHLLRRIGERTGCAIHAYVLMRNHVHLLLTVSEARSPSRMMQTLGRRYVRYFNDRVERTGTLWEGRFRSSVIDSERYFFQCSRYIEMNPVRAGLAMRPVDYPWSSYRCNALGAFDGL